MEAITPRYRAAVLLAAWCGLRRGEILGFARTTWTWSRDGHRSPQPRRAAGERRAAFDAEPKTDAGKRTVAIPPHVLPVLPSTWRVGRAGPGVCRPRRSADAGRRGAPGFRPGPRRRACPASGSTTCGTPARRWRRHRRDGQGPDAPSRSRFAGRVVPYLHAVDGRDAEIAAALSDLAAHGDAARLPKSIVVKH